VRKMSKRTKKLLRLAPFTLTGIVLLSAYFFFFDGQVRQGGGGGRAGREEKPLLNFGGSGGNGQGGNSATGGGEAGAGEACSQVDQIEYMYYKDTDVLWKKNNKVGLYVYAENREFFELAQKLVNSNGGDWGYVLIPYNVSSDRDRDKWERVFDQLQNKHLIPIVQLHGVSPDKYKKQTKESAKFLNSFIWPVRYRYISVYNEPNDPKFWYGRVDPAEYAKILNYTVKRYKEESEDFFIMNGAFNVSAPSDGVHLSSLEYMYLMNQEVPGIFERLDGWASHSYPQPNFSGNPYATGRWSIQAYDVELTYLRETLGVEKELPVFITETGWAHAEGANYNGSYLPVSTVADFFKKAYEEVWFEDDRVRAVIPFTIWYEPPFDHFSWINTDKVPYEHYGAVKKIKKISGEPPTLETSVLEVGSCD
jgi:hypothetical protein